MARWQGAHGGALRLAVLAALLLAAQARPVPQLAEPDYTLYHTKDGVFQAVREIVAGCPAMMRIDEESQTDGNYTSALTVVTVEPAGLSSSHENKARLLLNFGEHGRELISSEIALHLLRLLCDEGARLPLLHKFGIPPADVHQLLQRTVFKARAVVPMENVRGRERVERGELCERKNGRGVDPNRNWEVHWGFKEKDYDPREEYPGSAPFSEPEAALMLGVARALRPHVWASVHSGMEALFMPYDHVATVPEGEGPAATLSILQQINQRTCKSKCAVGSGGKSVGYLAHGTATDYMYDRLGVPIPMTWEVYGDQRAAYEDCFRMFNPLSRQQYNATVESWTAAIFTLLTLLPQHPQVQGELHLPGGPGGAALEGGGPGGAGAAGRNVAGDSGSGAEAGGGAGTRGSAGALGRRGDAGGEGAKQQEQQQEQAGTVAGGTGGGDGGGSQASQEGGSGSGGQDGSSSSSADKAIEIASALKEHLQQQQQQEQHEGDAGAEKRQEQQPSGGGAAETASSSGQGAGGQTAAPKRSRTLSTLYWLTVLVTGSVIASYLWSKPRVRYQLSKWLGSSRRRARGVVPL
ncbi:hypothetical protein CHLNCDRAFT_144224 [Chlorella variabilis]|uniref:Peptidase M14 domain-containing protein n=1 Tax=Chlorella variabilis TaxID=554065 RepID=E1ZC72_CHLVA|nr:hypothetical protein CHLNCDRAFT_144224 [Chlorella variabilis]EFN56559.1 hypothetical protein CHLNCDRAFT_144224 [Chlorella variabilis]|eukprot:XP_005848661.1 hypothetical protein CHLNCDRAFT_144224 [Chlorella variabilis]